MFLEFPKGLLQQEGITCAGHWRAPVRPPGPLAPGLLPDHILVGHCWPLAPQRWFLPERLCFCADAALPRDCHCVWQELGGSIGDWAA